MKQPPEFRCPICQDTLSYCQGHSLSKEGFTLYCANLNCPPQEVAGWGLTKEKAYSIILDKFKRK